jgi:hypothetical protein
LKNCWRNRAAPTPEVWSWRYDQGAGQDQRRRKRAPAGVRRRRHCAEARRAAELYGPQNQLRPGRGAYFPLDSKVIDKIDVVRSAKVRRAKLYYLRGLKGKAARLKEVEQQ